MCEQGSTTRFSIMVRAVKSCSLMISLRFLTWEEHTHGKKQGFRELGIDKKVRVRVDKSYLVWLMVLFILH